MLRHAHIAVASPHAGKRKLQTPQVDVPISLPSVRYRTGIPATLRPASTESWDGSLAAPCSPRDHQLQGCAHPASPSPWRSHPPREHAPLLAPAPKAKVMKLFQAVPRQVLPGHRHPCVAGNVTAAGTMARKGTRQALWVHSEQKAPKSSWLWGRPRKGQEVTILARRPTIMA